MREHTNLSNVWIVKPTNLNQGREIYLFSELHELVKRLCLNRMDNFERLEGVQTAEERVSQMMYNYVIAHRSLIVQKYIEGPLLIEECKFDIRIWVLIDQSAKFYMF